MTTDNPTQNDRVSTARESFSGRLLTEPQFEEALAITQIIEREIQKSGTFKEKLGDYTHAFARSEKFDAVKAETIVRDLFKERTGRSMNQMREALMDREEHLTEREQGAALDYAQAIGPLIENGNDTNGHRMTFHRAYAGQAQALARDLGVTDNFAKTLMSTAFKTERTIELYDWGKELEQKFYRPVIDAGRQRRDGASERSFPEREKRTGPARS